MNAKIDANGLLVQGGLSAVRQFVDARPTRAAAGSPKAKQPVVKATPFVFRDPRLIPRREWLYGTHYIRGFVSMTIAPGGVGKSVW